MRHRSVALTAALAMVLAGCGGGDPPEVASDEPGGPAGETGSAEADADRIAASSCDLAATEGGTELAVDAYEQVVLEANFELELLAMDLAADLDELLSGVSDGPTLEEQLLGHRDRYAEATAELGEVLPPAGAEEWHQRAMESFDSVCVAIADGLAGSAADDDRFDAFIDAITAFPNVLNQLHANAACGPLEAC